jgi:hypothetical protein
MKKPCSRYANEIISCFIDNEVNSVLHNEILQHQSQCPDCSPLIEQYRSAAARFTQLADSQTAGLNLDRKTVKSVQAIPAARKKPIFLPTFLFNQNRYLKLAAIAAILVISLAAFQKNHVNEPKSPSAIVKSIDTDFTSVMIIETQKEKHTIIWFSET